MKNLLALSVLLLATSVYADTPLNPDRFFSVGLDYSSSHLNNAYPGLILTNPDGGQNTYRNFSQDITNHFLTVDFRMPLTNAITLNAHGGKWTQTAWNGNSDGFVIGGGLRYYFVTKE